MKIDSSYKATTATIAAKAQTPKAAPAAEPTESVSLSQLGSTLAGSEKPPVNSARIQEIKQAISEGRFKINPEAIADRLIESARDLVSSGSKQEA
ncbi:flagellar biosynthesis anti-sigma factor FlgM [Dechloromonas denitrificans]|uniref:flagellar biosynthesis anti-sigma factor FlgM n=1 Tax=Azonexaceae TaxID=2008795 RepID=UPI001CF8E038|nr:flagellar biosynthesis anti-sigma factor FlgM [Dechloromonas denitrificans]UCV04537.1 flagellar biosynthesis anti-sigma factor FlgM [Dechloromonas denitrificans]UCV08867.1 flagellar biosynthesis anti-sigma factor FlgM [Dechloromonas denitrificans]